MTEKVLILKIKVLVVKLLLRLETNNSADILVK